MSEAWVLSERGRAVVSEAREIVRGLLGRTDAAAVNAAGDALDRALAGQSPGVEIAIHCGRIYTSEVAGHKNAGLIDVRSDRIRLSYSETHQSIAGSGTDEIAIEVRPGADFDGHTAQRVLAGLKAFSEADVEYCIWHDAPR